MIDIHRVLCTTDYSDCADSAIPVAASLANMFSAELHLLHVVELHGDGPEKRALAELEDRARSVDLDKANLVTAKLGGQPMQSLSASTALVNSQQPYPLQLQTPRIQTVRQARPDRRSSRCTSNSRAGATRPLRR